MPSTTLKGDWLYATAATLDFPGGEHGPDRAGKWLWFLPVRALDAGWRLVKKAVEQDQLGPRAKVSTLGTSFDGDPTRRPVIIYTADSTDEDDVTRVLHALRDLGINDYLNYKADAATQLGHYGDGTSLYTSPARTRKVVTLTPRYL